MASRAGRGGGTEEIAVKQEPPEVTNPADDRFGASGANFEFLGDEDGGYDELDPLEENDRRAFPWGTPGGERAGQDFFRTNEDSPRSVPISFSPNILEFYGDGTKRGERWTPLTGGRVRGKSTKEEAKEEEEEAEAEGAPATGFATPRGAASLRDRLAAERLGLEEDTRGDYVKAAIMELAAELAGSPASDGIDMWMKRIKLISDQSSVFSAQLRVLSDVNRRLAMGGARSAKDTMQTVNIKRGLVRLTLQVIAEQLASTQQTRRGAFCSSPYF